MAEIPIRFVSLCHMFGVLIIAFGVESNKTSLTSILVPLGMGIMIPVSNLEETFIIALFLFFFIYFQMGTYAYRCFHLRRLKKPDRISKLLAGLTLAIVGLLLFSLVETEANYQVRTL